MSATIDGRQDQLQSLRRRHHPCCFACGQGLPGGLGLHFVVQSDGAVSARADLPATMEGYERIAHGGVVATLLDSAMMHALLAGGTVALTAELNVRYRHPVRTNVPVEVRAWVERSTEPLHLVAAELIQEGQVRAQGRGKFMTKPQGRVSS